MGKDLAQQLRDSADLQLIKSRIEFKFANYGEAARLCESAASNIMDIPEQERIDDDYYTLYQIYDYAQLAYAAENNTTQYNKMCNAREHYPNKDFTEAAIGHIKEGRKLLEDLDLDNALGYIKYMAIPLLKENIAKHPIDRDVGLLLQSYAMLIDICNHDLKDNLHGILKDDLLLKDQYLEHLEHSYNMLQHPGSQDSKILNSYICKNKAEEVKAASNAAVTFFNNRNIEDHHNFSLRSGNRYKRY